MEGILLGILVVILGLGGKTFLLTMAKWPILGSALEWYLNAWGDMGTGFTETVFYGSSTLILIVIAYWLVFRAPFLMYRGIKWAIVRPAKEKGI